MEAEVVVGGWLEQAGLTLPFGAVWSAILTLALVLMGLSALLWFSRGKLRSASEIGLAKKAAQVRKTKIASLLDPARNEYMSSHSYDDYEIVEECEEGNSRGGRSWYNLEGEDVAWYPPHRTYRRVSDFVEGMYLRFEQDTAPYEIEHTTHSRFRCMFCREEMREVGFYARGASFYGKESEGSHDRYERTVRRCSFCGWWLINMGYMAYSDDEYAWYRNETIYVQGVLAKFNVSTIEAGLAAVVGHLKAKGRRLSDTSITELSALIARFLGARGRRVTLHRVGTREAHGIELMLLRSPTGSSLIHVKRSVEGSEWESLAAVRILNGVLIADDDIPSGVIVTTSKPISTAELQTDWEDGGALAPGGFYRHEIENVNLDAVLEAAESREFSEPAFEQHIVPATFEEWKSRFSFKPFHRFRRLSAPPPPAAPTPTNDSGAETNSASRDIEKGENRLQNHRLRALPIRHGHLHLGLCSVT